MPTEPIGNRPAQGGTAARSAGIGKDRAAGADPVLTCRSCYWWRMTGCYSKVPGFPNRGQGKCRYFNYDPGVDEGNE